MTSCALIVNADDFGISEAINDGIVAAHVSGIVTSTTLLATGDAFEHAVRLSGEHATLDVGVHLALVGQRPLLPASQLPSLVTEAGVFHDSIFAFARRYLAGRVNEREVEHELDAQLERARARVAISHVDSHQHAHVLPAITRIVERLCARHGIGALRWPLETPRWRDLRSPRDAFRVAQLCGLHAAGWSGLRAGLWRPDGFRGFLAGGSLDEAELLRIIRSLPQTGTVELMCHPGLSPPASHYPAWGYQWQRELDALRSSAVRQSLVDKGIELKGYRDCLGGPG